MTPTKDNLKSEILHRLSLIEKSMQENKENEMLYLFLCNEHTQINEFFNLIEIFEDRIGYENFLESNFTPIVDYKTKEPLKIGDKVENNNRQCGTLKFDECFNKYVIKTETGGYITSSSYVKIKELYDYDIDNIKVECRREPNKKKW
jgi:hypothetical protein